MASGVTSEAQFLKDVRAYGDLIEITMDGNFAARVLELLGEQPLGIDHGITYERTKKALALAIEKYEQGEADNEALQHEGMHDAVPTWEYVVIVTQNSDFKDVANAGLHGYEVFNVIPHSAVGSGAMTFYLKRQNGWYRP